MDARSTNHRFGYYMAKKSKPFRVAVEGATVDGREIQRDWLTQAAANYDPALFGARMNVEHIKGWAPMSATYPFGAYGDVLALSASVIEDGPLKGKMALYAEIDPTDQLVQLTDKRQKIYTSIEINPSFADTGQAYLVGLAATDDPASLGTEALKFAARRSSNVHSSAHETSIEFDGAPAEPGVLSFVKNLFARNRETDETRNADMRQAIEEVASFASNFASQQGPVVTKLRADLDAARQDVTAARKRADDAFAAIEALKEQLSSADSGAPRRQPSTGGSGAILTDV
ncbi:GPO family capsid scaffolding protein [Burkholderia gladioli pv. gladioli]|nr:GPO family capsid scaffolding protein [Burkholderia gladioli]MDJ1161779.1 GPO family capsid scaffolding protein [Burkholderia gladioli pv. gladioli]